MLRRCLAAALLLVLGACSSDPELPEKPQIFPDLTELSYGKDFRERVWVGTKPQMTVSPQNKGQQTLVIGELTISGANASLFTYQIDTKEVPSLQRANITVTYAPTSAGVHSAVLTIKSNAENMPELAIGLNGEAVVNSN